MAHAIPTSVRSGPMTTNTLPLNRYLWLHFILIWLSLLPVIYSFAGLLLLLTQMNRSLLFVMIVAPLYVVYAYIIFAFTAIFWSWLFYRCIVGIYPPIEGEFPREIKNKHFRGWILRAMVKKYAIWVSHNFPLPWMDLLVFRIFGNKIAWTAALFDGWIDAELLEIGKDTMVGQGCVIQTAMITPTSLILQKVQIGKKVVLGAHSVLNPGTIIYDEVVLGALSMTTLGQVLESHWVYAGRPAMKFSQIENQEVHHNQKKPESTEDLKSVKVKIDPNTNEK